jgi:hypothetical protein
MKTRHRSEKVDVKVVTSRPSLLSRRDFVSVSASVVAGLACAPRLDAAEAVATTAHGPRAEVKPYHGVPWLLINGEPHAPHFYYFPLPVAEHIAGFARSGIDLLTWGWGSHINHSMDLGWKGPGQFDYAKFDAEVELILKAKPQAWLLPSLGVAAPT